MNELYDNGLHPKSLKTEDRRYHMVQDAGGGLDTGIRKLVPRYQKRVEVRGDYVEK